MGAVAAAEHPITSAVLGAPAFGLDADDSGRATSGSTKAKSDLSVVAFAERHTVPCRY
jgi:hypothetical protein